jgi:hypothetical protein
MRPANLGGMPANMGLLAPIAGQLGLKIALAEPISRNYSQNW